jgi:hypothetical protein
MGTQGSRPLAFQSTPMGTHGFQVCEEEKRRLEDLVLAIHCFGLEWPMPFLLITQRSGGSHVPGEGWKVWRNRWLISDWQVGPVGGATHLCLRRSENIQKNGSLAKTVLVYLSLEKQLCIVGKSRMAQGQKRERSWPSRDGGPEVWAGRRNSWPLRQSRKIWQRSVTHAVSCRSCRSCWL